MAQCLSLHTNISWPSQGPSKRLNWIFCNAFLFIFIITQISSYDEPSFKMLFGDRFLSMTYYATNYCTYESIKLIQGKFRFLQTRTTKQEDVQWHLEESSFKIIIRIFIYFHTQAYFWISIRATKSCCH